MNVDYSKYSGYRNDDDDDWFTRHPYWNKL